MMSSAEIRHELLEEIDRLDPREQARLLEVARDFKSTSVPGGMPWEEMKKYRGIISNEEAEEMKRVIEEDCERIDPEGW